MTVIEIFWELVDLLGFLCVFVLACAAVAMQPDWKRAAALAIAGVAAVAWVYGY